MRGTWAFSLLVALVAVPAAAAHVKLSPAQVAPGAETVLVFTVPDERGAIPAVGLEVVLPPGLRAEQVEAKPGWRVVAAGRRVSWRGGRIAPGRFETFGISVTAPGRPGSVALTVRELYADGDSDLYHPTMTVTAAAPARTRDAGARTLGKAALFLAIAAGAVAVGAGFLALYVWLRSPSKLSES